MVLACIYVLRAGNWTITARAVHGGCLQARRGDFCCGEHGLEIIMSPSGNGLDRAKFGPSTADENEMRLYFWDLDAFYNVVPSSATFFF